MVDGLEPRRILLKKKSSYIKKQKHLSMRFSMEIKPTFRKNYPRKTGNLFDKIFFLAWSKINRTQIICSFNILFLLFSFVSPARK